MQERRKTLSEDSIKLKLGGLCTRKNDTHVKVDAFKTFHHEEDVASAPALGQFEFEFVLLVYTVASLHFEVSLLGRI